MRSSYLPPRAPTMIYLALKRLVHTALWRGSLHASRFPEAILDGLLRAQERGGGQNLGKAQEEPSRDRATLQVEVWQRAAERRHPPAAQHSKQQGPAAAVRRKKSAGPEGPAPCREEEAKRAAESIAMAGINVQVVERDEENWLREEEKMADDQERKVDD